MSALVQEPWSEPAERTIPADVFRRIDRSRGTSAMKLVIATEAMLFVVLFFGYFFLSGGDPRWLHETPPKLKLALPMLAILLASSAVLHLGERASRKGRFAIARASIAATILLGAAFLTLQVFEYRDHWKHLTPQTNAYGSIFYTITTLHGLHVCSGMLMLLYVLFLPKLDPETELPFRPLHNAGLYWHFVDSVWVFVVALLYVLPNLR
jgi:heme/copper-type cytochrome/quinol oxidase subunit 3